MSKKNYDLCIKSNKQQDKTMTQRETDNFDAYYDEIADEQYEMWKEQKEIPQLRTIDTTSLQRSLDRMAAIIREFDEVTR